MIRKIAGKQRTMPIKYLSKDNYIITDKKTITELLVETFSKNSSKQNGKKEFLTIKEDAEKHELNFKSKNLEEYDNLLTLRELKDYIEKSHNSTFGPDEIHYKFLKKTSWKIPKISLENTEQNMDRGKIHRFMETNHNSTNPQAKKRTAQIHKTADLSPQPVSYAKQWKE